MSERQFRFILGALLWLILVYTEFFNDYVIYYGFLLFLLFEGVTNLRLPLVISKLRYGNVIEEAPTVCAINPSIANRIDAERILRFVVVFFLSIELVFPYEIIWFIPWFVSGMLILAGISNICPMVMFLRWVGFK